MIAPYNCVVVANGSFPQTALPLRLLHEASVVIACDGAIEALDKAGITPAAIVGDLDSIPSCFRERYADRIHIVEDQEINDLTKSVRFAHRSGEQEVLILGATGLREDHTLGNISLLMDYAPLFRRIEMLFAGDCIHRLNPVLYRLNPLSANKCYIQILQLIQ